MLWSCNTIKGFFQKQKHLLVPIVPISERCLYFGIFLVYFDVKSRTMLWWWCVSVCIGKSTERLVVAVKASNFHCKDHCQEMGQRNRRRQRSTITTIIIIIPSYDIKWATYFYSGERRRSSHVFTVSKKKKKSQIRSREGREVILLCSSNLLKINTAEILYRIRSFFV